MNRYIIIENNKIISERLDSRNEIQNNEIEDDGTYGKYGETLINGIWKIDPKEIVEQQKQERIIELEQVIDRKLRLGDNVDTERAELRELYGL